MNTSPVGGLQLLLNHRHKYNIKEISIHVTTVEKVKKETSTGNNLGEFYTVINK